MAATFVLGYDGSDCSKAALQRTAELASQMADARVVVVYAFEFSIGYVPTGMADSPLLMSAEFDEHSDLVRGYADEQAKQAVAELAKAGVKAEPHVEEGRPVEVLLQVAKDAAATLLVVGSHGEGGLSAAFIGSTALKLLHHSELPVLVVPRHKG
jgi:nucleotide-binding universal stress UspA family protein